MTVRVVDNMVIEIVPDYATPVEKYYSPEFCAQCFFAPDGVEQGWIYDPNNGLFLDPSMDPEYLDEKKHMRIQQSKDDLAAYLESNPILWTDGLTYSITAERQAQLTSTLVCAQADGQPPEWNSTGGVCREWDAQELTALGVAIKNRVKALVKYQQEKELEIMAAASQEALDAIEVDYDSVG